MSATLTEQLADVTRQRATSQKESYRAMVRLVDRTPDQVIELSRLAHEMGLADADILKHVQAVQAVNSLRRQIVSEDQLAEAAKEYDAAERASKATLANVAHDVFAAAPDVKTIADALRQIIPMCPWLRGSDVGTGRIHTTMVQLGQCKNPADMLDRSARAQQSIAMLEQEHPLIFNDADSW